MSERCGMAVRRVGMLGMRARKIKTPIVEDGDSDTYW